MTATITQTDGVLAILQARGSLTPLEALDELGCFRLAARVYELRAEGHHIESEHVTKNGKSYVRYVMPAEPEQRALWGDR